MTNAGKNSWASWLVFLVGLWLVFAPTLLGYSDLATPSGNSVVVGFAIAALGFINAVWGRFTEPWLGWVAAAIGLWEILAPFFLGYSDVATATTNAIISGIAVVALAGYRAVTTAGVNT